jgi:Fungal Zn(2)-Cys(6) binuclear cluster domain
MLSVLVDVTLKSQDTISGGENSGKEATKRKRGLEETEDESEVPRKYAGHEGNNLENSMQNESGEKQGALRRRKWSRRNGNPNIQYRYNLRFNSQEQKEENVNGNGGILSRNSTSDGVSGLFQLLRTTIASKKIYPRRKKQSEQAETGASEGVTTAQEGDEPTSTADNNEATSSTEVAPKKTRASARRVKHNPRPHISEDTVRSTAPRGWNPYDNDFYSGDDNISDDYLENRGKSSAYKPPRMACRRCNKLKQPCDHGYPSCSLCAKNNLRCRYRDDLTGRQIRPGQLEEVEAAYYHSREEIRRLEDIVEEQKRLLEEANERVNAWQTAVRNMMELRNVLGGNLSSEGLQNTEKFAEE